MEHKDTIPEGRRIVLWHPLPRKMTVNGHTVIVYDLELAIMLIKDWGARGMSREDIADLLLYGHEHWRCK